MTIFNENVRKAITANGKTITGLADEIGMPREALSKILNGRVDPTSSTLNRIAEGLETTLWELFRPENEQPKHRKKAAQVA